MGYGTEFSRTHKKKLTKGEQARYEAAKERYNAQQHEARHRNHSNKQETLNKL